jgi:hypothetical protein
MNTQHHRQPAKPQDEIQGQQGFRGEKDWIANQTDYPTHGSVTAAYEAFPFRKTFQDRTRT